MSNVYKLFPSPTDRQYEDEIVPVLVQILEKFAELTADDNFDEYIAISGSLLRFSRRSLILLDHHRREGMYDEGRMPPITAYDIDNLAADCVLVMGGEHAEETARRFRKRMQVNGDEQ